MRLQPASFCILLQRESLLLEIQAVWMSWHFWRKEVQNNILVGLKKWIVTFILVQIVSLSSLQQYENVGHAQATLPELWFSSTWMFSLSAWKCYLIYKSCSCKLIFLETFSFKTFKSTGGKCFIQDLSTL